MNQTVQLNSQKKKWETPVLINLSVDADTKTGSFGASSDFSNTTTANNTVSS